MGRNIIGIDEDGMKFLVSQQWEGNVRELENTIERAVVMAQTNVLDAASFQPLDFFAEQNSSMDMPPTDITIHEMEKRLILSTLGYNSNNRTKTADTLGISIRTLRNKLNEYRSQDPELTKIIDK